MRGPKIPVFVNSEIADSWAFRIEWEDPNGVLRGRYIQPTKTHFKYNGQTLPAVSLSTISDASPYFTTSSMPLTRIYALRDLIRTPDATRMMTDYGLHNVNIPWGSRPKGKRSVPQKCDSCVLEAEKNQGCMFFHAQPEAEDHEDEAFKARYRPLLHLAERDTGSMDTIDPELQVIPSMESDEVPDGELDV
ncbi:hypothetical protein T440DRAFT_550840 [Plenodomus tracheiphilus IPT5]|uniref:Uncharacterized protein n=1 Tax=Plenodomus tracheiphilus IPT5 TaxID=1408161 RepID=A0A6A7BJL8_9PLEO|nr:hypothetical protein T440DRAFT_550840 [Plenodomus tracheiphilus IPT5]